MSNLPVISVILTTCESEAYIQRTLDSIFQQKGLNIDFRIELIVIDDCSTDQTTPILAENGIAFYSTDTRSTGPNKARNIGLALASGTYICLMDSDDIWERDKLSSQLKIARFYPIVSTGYRVIDATRGQTFIYSAGDTEVHVYPKNQTFLQRLINSNVSHRAYVSTLMFHRQLKDVQFEEYIGMLDYDWYLRLFENQSSAEISRPLMNRHVSQPDVSLHKACLRNDYYYTLMCLDAYQSRYPREVALAKKQLGGSQSRYAFLNADLDKAISHYEKAPRDLRTVFHYLATYYGDHNARKHYRVFGS